MVFPLPGGATITTGRRSAKAARTRGITWSMGSTRRSVRPMTSVPVDMARVLLLAAPMRWMLLILLGGCSTPCGDPAAAWVELGRGPDAFRPVADGEVLLVERGAQGGMHVWGALRAGGIDPGPDSYLQGIKDGSLPTVAFELRDDEGVLTLDNRAFLVLEQDGDAWASEPRIVQFRHFAELPPDWTELDYAAVEAEMETREFRLRVELEDACEAAVADERTVGLRFPPRS